MKSGGSSARFSAQSVSMTPEPGSSVARTKPLSSQNWRTVVHACSGVVFTWSQRSLPSFMIFTSAITLGAIWSPVLGLVASRAARPEAVDTL